MIRKYIRHLPSYIKNRYSLSVIIFIVWLTFFDRNDFISQFSYYRMLRHLRHEKQYYIEEIQKSHDELMQLKTNPKNLEKFARETYLMKKDDEDVFVLVNESAKSKKE